jgi:alanyl-tRNA synthetase
MTEYESLFRDHCCARGFPCKSNTDVTTSNPKLLFNISGGVPLEGAIAGEEKPVEARTASIQRCIRTDAWPKIGVSGRHHIAFDMLGHFSLYELPEEACKELMIELAWTYATEQVGIRPDRLHATVHPEDAVTQSVWNGLGVRTVVQAENVSAEPRGKRTGLRSEIVWRRQDGTHLELWNLVFHQFEGAGESRRPLPLIAADSGMSLDRLVTAAEEAPTNYENSLWKVPTEAIRAVAPTAEPHIVYRLADMAKAAACMAASGVKPGNKVSAYVLRRVIREACMIARNSGINPTEVLQAGINYWLVGQPEELGIRQAITGEADKFNGCLERGEKEAKKLLVKNGGTFTDGDYALLAETYGYPREMAAALVGGASGG